MFVRVTNASDGGDALKPVADVYTGAGAAAAGLLGELVPQLGIKETDIVVTKRQWGRVLWHGFGTASAAPLHPHDRTVRYLHQYRRGIDRA